MTAPNSGGRGRGALDPLGEPLGRLAAATFFMLVVKAAEYFGGGLTEAHDSVDCAGYVRDRP